MSDDSHEQQSFCQHYNFPFIKYFLRHRKVYLWGEIAENNSLFVAGALLYLANKNKENIYLYINSCGGDICWMVPILDAMDKVKNDGINLYTIVSGEAASAASCVLMNGSPGCRIATPNSVIMLHQIQYSVDFDSAGKNKKFTEFVHRQNEQFIELMATLCNKTTNAKLKKFKDDIGGGDLWFSSREAQKYNVVDSVSDL